MYAVVSEGAEYSFFAPDEVNSELKSLRKGDKAIITKLAAQRGNKLLTTYEVKVVSADMKVPTIQSEESDVANEQPEHDRYFDIMLQCYKEALDISRELNGMADPEKIAVTLFIARSKSNGY
jgi:hypothetical protein